MKSTEGPVMRILQNHHVLKRRTAELTGWNQSHVSTSLRIGNTDGAQTVQIPVRIPRGLSGRPQLGASQNPTGPPRMDRCCFERQAESVLFDRSES